ncbi:MAG TPA: class I SAM-dependent methyltransferase [Tepidisphaeraceae bacterium]|nr:class I SAM-dependent methyltransferase [Tepidisphaeraceae bacterium]
MKSTVDEIRARFDQEVERFSVLETGQSATMDAPLVLDLITAAAAGVTPKATRLLDVGCGAGNYSLKMLQRLPDLNVTLVDLSRPMLDRAHQRLSAVSRGNINLVQGDVQQIELGEGQFDIIVAAAVLHHLRTDDQWRSVFAKFHRALAVGGSIWISDLIQHTLGPVQNEMWARYGQYLADLKGEKYRDHVFGYIEKEDTPRSLMFQLDLLRDVGFAGVEVLHKSAVFAAFGAVKK